MKKAWLLVLLCLVFLVTGCGKSQSASKDGVLSCSKETVDGDGFKTTDTLVVTYKDNKVSKIENTVLSEVDTENIDLSLMVGQTTVEVFKDIDGIDMVYSKDGNNVLKYVLTIDYEILDSEKLKASFGDDFDESAFLEEKDVPIDKFKKENLVEYECK